MRYPAVLPFSEVLPRLSQFDTIIDVRSPGEFAEDHIPGAINCPVLDDAERVLIGTMYKNVGAFEAKKLGAALVAKNIARHIEVSFLPHPHDWKPLIYCWRGGNRSGAMALILAKIGWPVTQLEGGYKAYRAHVNASLAQLAQQFHFHVLCGPTGSGKSALLRILEKQNEQVLDLEKLALHRGSVLGHLPFAEQPSQKAFESSLWQLLQQFDTARPVFVEAESKKVGSLRIPDALMATMRSSPCTAINLSMPHRVKFLMEEYAHFVADPALLNRQLDHLIPLHGRETVTRWQQLAIEGQIPEMVGDLLKTHYDPAYQASIRRNFSQIELANVLALPDILEQSFEHAARQLVDVCATHAGPTSHTAKLEYLIH